MNKHVAIFVVIWKTFIKFLIFHKYRRFETNPSVIYTVSRRQKPLEQKKEIKITSKMKFFILAALLIGLTVAQNNRRDPRCPATNGNNGALRLPHPTDCGSFLTCHFGSTIETRCPNNHHWSVNSNSCESPERAGCTLPNQRPVPPNFPQRPNIPNPRPEVEHPDYLNCPNFDTPGKIVYFPYHLNCSHFYQCVNGRAVL